MSAYKNKVIDFAHERLRRRACRLTDIFHDSRDLICVCREGRIAAINSAGVRLLGARSREALNGRSFVRFLLPEYRTLLDRSRMDGDDDGRPIPVRLRGLDRAVRDIEVRIYPVRRGLTDMTAVIARVASGD